MTVYLKREDIPNTCRECRFFGEDADDICLLWDKSSGAAILALNEKKAGCPIRCVDELVQAESNAVEERDEARSRAADAELLVEEAKAEINRLKAKLYDIIVESKC